MIHSTYVGVTTMRTFQQALSNTANNIANSQTVGHKAQKSNFTDLVYNRVASAGQADVNTAAINPTNVGNGVKMGSISTNFGQGSLNSTGGKTDVALEGDGYFVVGNRNGEDMVYTRKGSFQLSKEQMLVTDGGKYVYGWNVDPITGQIDTDGQSVPIFIPLNSAVAGKESTEVSFQGNIDSGMEVGQSTKLQFPSYDTAGNQINVDMNFVKKDDGTFKYVAIPSGAFQKTNHLQNAIFNVEAVSNQIKKGDYNLTITPDGSGTNVTIEMYEPGNAVPIVSNTFPNATGTLELEDASGNVWMTLDFTRDVNPSTATVTVGDVGEIKYGPTGRLVSTYSYPDPSVPLGATPQEPEIQFNSPYNGSAININSIFDQITLYSTDSSISVYEVNGNSASSLQDYSISDGGNIQAYYTDGTIRDIGKIAVATFANNNGLERIGGESFKETIASGFPVTKVSGQNGAAIIRAQSLENSNVDLASEFVDLMAYQKAFQAGTKVIQVSDELVTGVIGLIR